MANLILPLILAIITFVTLAKNVGSLESGFDEMYSAFQCSSSYGRLIPSKQYFEQKSVIRKGSKSFSLTLPKFKPEKPVAFVCIDIADFDAKNTNVLYSITNGNVISPLIMLNKEAKEDIPVKVRIMFVNNSAQPALLI